MRKVFALLAGVLVCALVNVGVAAADNSGNFVCANYIGLVHAAHDLIVPNGDSCGPTEGSTIGHDALVGVNSAFFPGGTTIGHDVLAAGADLVELGDPNNGTTDTIVGHDVIVTGTQGMLPFGQFICQTRIGHDLVITNTQPGVAQWWVGYLDPSNCGRNYGRGGDTIGHDALFANNANTIYVGDNEPAFNGDTGPGFGHDLTFIHNTGAVNQLSDNTIVWDCRQRDNHPFDGFGNVAGHDVDGCNSSNP
jgi:hypothetical protein